jgi:hypothetical protein
MDVGVVLEARTETLHRVQVAAHRRGERLRQSMPSVSAISAVASPELVPIAPIATTSRMPRARHSPTMHSNLRVLLPP